MQNCEYYMYKVIYFKGNRLEDTVSLSNIFKLNSDTTNFSTASYTLWLAVASDNSTIQEFLSLSKETLPPNETPSPNLNPYYSALQYYNYINTLQNDKHTHTQNAQNAPTPDENQEPPPNPLPADDREEFDFLGGRPAGVGLEEAQEQNAIVTAINLIVRLSLLLYITYQFAPQYKFYLVIAFSALTFLYQLGVFRINRVNIPRFQQVDNAIRDRENNGITERNNPQNEIVKNKNTENTEVKTRDTIEPVIDNKDEISVETGEDGSVKEKVGTSIVTEEVIENNPGVINSICLLLKNLVFSFHPEHNVQL
ncbi:hypothetical protein LOD99_11636 [Oopsacas minuta]|uniref:Homocysteine-responsive endoplasmic reticulum-resident ubiquitin-like domain member 2 protein n=1 Tax=Oopsacas minuta TaxID=111878 RepID=A0AAV7JLH8_9METZ|nr:hypothetical protein LOD99_11636 [Oopsacas minuta]